MRCVNSDRTFPSANSSKLLIASLLLSTILATLFLVATWSCLSTNANGGACLAFLTPVVGRLISWNNFPANYTRLFYYYIFLGVTILASSVALVSLIRRKFSSFWVCVSLCIALIGEYLILQGKPYEGTVVILGAIPVLVLLGLLLPGASSEKEGFCKPISFMEGVAFVLVSITLTFTQFYFLNRIPAGWDTESCPMRAIFWTSWWNVLSHEAGLDPQTSAGLSWNSLMTLLGHTDEPDNYYLYIRVWSSALASLKFLLTFFFVRYLCGTFAAFLSIALLGFGPPENWWSREPSLHQVPGLAAVIFIWLVVRAWRLPTYGNFLLASFMTGVMRFLYPSGMLLAFAPPIFFSLLLLFRWSEWKKHFFKIMTLGLGLAFWWTWRTIARGIYSGDWTLVSPVLLPGSYADIPFATRIVRMLPNVIDTFNSIFVYQVHPTHWTGALNLGPERVTTSIVTILFLLALARFIRFASGPIGFFLFICLFLTFIPGMMTEVAARRMGAAFVILIIIAAREADFLTKLLMSNGNAWVAKGVRLLMPLAACVYFTWICSAEHFRRNPGIPPQVVAGQLLREELKDNSLVVLFHPGSPCDLFFSMYRELLQRNCAIGFSAPDFEGAPETKTLIENPTVRFNSWFYQNTEIKKCIEAQRNKQWDRVLYLISEGTQTPGVLKLLRAQYPQAIFKEKKRSHEASPEHKAWVVEVPYEQISAGQPTTEPSSNQ